jgi:hypothetical protein
MSFTVVPLHNVDLPAGTEISFGSGFVLRDIPGWMKSDQAFLSDLSRPDREATLNAKHAFVAEYQASALGDADYAWKGVKPKSIQEARVSVGRACEPRIVATTAFDGLFYRCFPCPLMGSS